MSAVLDTRREDTPRDWQRAIARGLRHRCPHCGEGHLFRAYLKPVEACAACGEEMHHQRADDAPPYVTIFIVGHVVVGALMLADELYPNVSMWLHMAIWTTVALVLSLVLLPSVKGALIGLQWALRMHGFGAAMPARRPA